MTVMKVTEDNFIPLLCQKHEKRWNIACCITAGW